MPRISSPRGDRQVAIDVEDPYNDRVFGERRRLALNDNERAILLRKDAIAKAVAMLSDGVTTMSEVAKELDIDESSLVRAVTHDEESELRSIVIDRMVSRYLDIRQYRTRSEMAAELGLTSAQFYYLTRSDDFIKAYNEHFIELASDPTIKAVRHKLVEDLLPRAFVTLGNLLNTANSENVRLKAALEVIKLSGITPVESSDNERRDAANFLKEKGIEINVAVANVPPEYRSAMDIITVDAQEVPPELE
jgi:hypothetical protein